MGGLNGEWKFVQAIEGWHIIAIWSFAATFSVFLNLPAHRQWTIATPYPE